MDNYYGEEALDSVIRYTFNCEMIVCLNRLDSAVNRCIWSRIIPRWNVWFPLIVLSFS